MNPSSSTRRGLCSISVGTFLICATAACGAPSPDPTSTDEPPGEQVAQSSQAILSSDVIARAQSWVDAQVPYCQAANHGWDAACGQTCNRTGAAANPAWDPYRSDCSGFVSWAWGLPPPGLVVTGLAKPSVSAAINAVDLQPGDALYASDHSHTFLFAGWATPHSKMHIMAESDCGKVAEAKDYSVSSISGSTVHFSWGTYTAARYNSISFAPPSCDRSDGNFTFSCDGAEPNLHCVNVDEPADPDAWSDNYFCSAKDLGMQWSSSGPIAGMDCTNVYEAADPEAAAWSDDYLCVPPQSTVALSYSSAGPLAGKSCVQWNEPADLSQSWSDNYLCSEPVYTFSAGGFSFGGAGPIDGKSCVNLDEPADPDTWSDNYFCSDADLGMQWSHAGPIDGMDCTNVTESADEQADAWSDNYLCLPKASGYQFSWSSAGPIVGKSCVRWFDHAENSDTWLDNWLCVEQLAPPTPPGSGGSGPLLGEPVAFGGAASTSSHQNAPVHAGLDTGCAIGPRPGQTPWAVLLALSALALRRRRD